MTDIVLYDGDIELTFDERRHRYLANGVRAPSVTQVLGILNKPALVTWAATCASDYIRGALTPGKSLDEVEIDRLADNARWAHRKVSRDAVSIGSLFHRYAEGFAEHHIRGTSAPVLPVNPEARRAVESWHNWLDENRVDFIASEVMVYSRRHDFAGTLDLLAKVNGHLVIVDYKTSKAIYPEYDLQAAAYAQAWAEMTEQVVQGAWVLRVPKDGGDFEAKGIDALQIDQLFKVFIYCRRILDWQQSGG